MKLIDILVKELPDLGGWPEGAQVCAQDSDGELCFFTGPEIHRRANNMVWAVPEGSYVGVVKRQIFITKADDMRSKIVYRGQYDIALALYNSTPWNGEGIPPTGCICEREAGGGKWVKCKIVYASKHYVVHQLVESGEEFAVPPGVFKFRKNRTTEEEKRELAATAMASAPKPCGHAIYPICLEIYEAIAAGKIPGVQLVEKE